MDSSLSTNTMKAWVGTRAGEPRQALQLQDRAMPSAPTGADLLVQVAYVALNPADAYFMGILPTLLPFRRSPVPGMDFSGTVVSAGPNVPSEFSAPGTRVCGSVSVALTATGRGSLAEFIVVPSHIVALQPQVMSPDQAAGLGVAGQTAVLLVREARVSKGNRVLINGASGGVGTFLVQLCKSYEAHVVGLCSAPNEEFVKDLGADETIDYTAHDLMHAHLAKKYADKPFDYIFDCVGHQLLFDKSPHYLKPSGAVISIVGGKSHGVVPFVKNKLWPRILGGTPRTYKILGLAPSGELEKDVVRFVDEGFIKKVPIDSEFNMDDALKAFDRLISKRSRGKVVIKVARRSR